MSNTKEVQAEVLTIDGVTLCKPTHIVMTTGTRGTAEADIWRGTVDIGEGLVVMQYMTSVLMYVNVFSTDKYSAAKFALAIWRCVPGTSAQNQSWGYCLPVGPVRTFGSAATYRGMAVQAVGQLRLVGS
jgi:hypothetical protein